MEELEKRFTKDVENSESEVEKNKTPQYNPLRAED